MSTVPAGASVVPSPGARAWENQHWCKSWRLEELLKRQNLTADRVAYVGDDLLDLPVLQQVGFAATVPEARKEVLAAAQFVTERSGGFGAARDVIEELLRARGVWRAPRGRRRRRTRARSRAHPMLARSARLRLARLRLARLAFRYQPHSASCLVG